MAEQLEVRRTLPGGSDGKRQRQRRAGGAERHTAGKERAPTQVRFPTSQWAPNPARSDL